MEKGLYDFKAVLRLASAALIGCGAAETTDMDVLRDVDGIPYIPATTMTAGRKLTTILNFTNGC